MRSEAPRGQKWGKATLSEGSNRGLSERTYEDSHRPLSTMRRVKLVDGRELLEDFVSCIPVVTAHPAVVKLASDPSQGLDCSHVGAKSERLLSSLVQQVPKNPTFSNKPGTFIYICSAVS